MPKNLISRKSLSLIGLFALMLLLYPTSIVFADRPFILRADAVWAESGIMVTAGESISIRASGHVITGGLREFPGARSNADGQITDCTMFDGVSPCALEDAPYGALIGRIGLTGDPFLIGASSTFTAASSGQLYLTINDNLPFYTDNRGVFVVRIDD